MKLTFSCTNLLGFWAKNVVPSMNYFKGCQLKMINFPIVLLTKYGYLFTSFCFSDVDSLHVFFSAPVKNLKEKIVD